MTNVAAAGGALGTAEQRREQMLRAALEVIAVRGYADTRISDVAERIGISPALVIYYFKTKDQLLTDAIKYLDNLWYADGQRRMTSLPTAAARIEEIVAMSCLPEADTDPHSSWKLWLDFWSLAARNPEVAVLRERDDERWRAMIGSVVREGQEAGEFRDLDPDNFAILLCSLLDGFAIQIALTDPVVDPARAFELCMLFIADQLGFTWNGGPGRRARNNHDHVEQRAAEGSGVHQESR
jgi:AcrR family transcriptional regulator